MSMERKGNKTISRILQEEKVLNPTAYWRSKGITRGGKKEEQSELFKIKKRGEAAQIAKSDSRFWGKSAQRGTIHTKFAST